MLQLPFFSDFFLRILLEFGIFPKKGEFFLKKNSMGMGFHCRQNGWKWGGGALGRRPGGGAGPATGQGGGHRDAVGHEGGGQKLRRQAAHESSHGECKGGRGQAGREGAEGEGALIHYPKEIL